MKKKYIKLNSDLKVIILLGLVILLLGKGCYEFLHIDYQVVDYVDADNKYWPLLFENEDIKVSVKYLGTQPHLTSIVMYDKKILYSIISYISISNKNHYSNKRKKIKNISKL